MDGSLTDDQENTALAWKPMALVNSMRLIPVSRLKYYLILLFENHLTAETCCEAWSV